jgi:hypothetical protein
MLIIWRGLGFLVPVIWLASAVLTNVLVGGVTYEHNGWPKFVAGLVAALVIGWAGGKLNAHRASGGTHTFFFLNMEVWAWISLFFGIILAAGH